MDHPTTFPDMANGLKWSIQNLQLQGNFDHLLSSIKEGTTNGSYKEGHGTAAFRIQNDHGNIITGCNITPGQQHQQYPYRSKLGGNLGTLGCSWTSYNNTIISRFTSSLSHETAMELTSIS
jgi:hypothetical protein